VHHKEQPTDRDHAVRCCGCCCSSAGEDRHDEKEKDDHCCDEEVDDRSRLHNHRHVGDCYGCWEAFYLMVQVFCSALAAVADCCADSW
jgi:hypothetical protein